jgi:hypothetical protein
MSEPQAFWATQSPSTFADNEQEYMGERLHDDQRWRKGFAIATARDLRFRRTRVVGSGRINRSVFADFLEHFLTSISFNLDSTRLGHNDASLRSLALKARRVPKLTCD